LNAFVSFKDLWEESAFSISVHFENPKSLMSFCSPQIIIVGENAGSQVLSVIIDLRFPKIYRCSINIELKNKVKGG
jgi:hypothetical protein